MKKIIAILMATALMLTGLAGCKNEEEKAEDIHDMMYQGGETCWTNDEGEVMYVDVDDLVVFDEYGDALVEGEYEIDGDELTITSFEDGEELVFTVKIKGDKLIFKDDEGEKREWDEISEEEAEEILEY